MGKQIAYRQLVRAGRAPGAFPMQDRRLWERALAATGNGAVRAEEVVEPEIAAISIAYPELMDKRRPQLKNGYRYVKGMRWIGYFSHRLLVKVRVNLFGQKISPFHWHTHSYPGCWYHRSWKWTMQ